MLKRHSESLLHYVLNGCEVLIVVSSIYYRNVALFFGNTMVSYFWKINSKH